MPLPLPNLDTRRWADLVEEARAIIPRHAPSWTDHNVHDPGITILEMLAWLVEQDIYHLNRIPDSHRRRFLALAGFAPRPPQPARVPLTFSLKNSGQHPRLNAGFTIAAAGAPWPRLRFQLEADLTIVPRSLVAVQVDDGGTFRDQTRLWQDGRSFPLWGQDPQAGAALYLGFDGPFPQGQNSTLCLWVQFAGESGPDARAHIRAEVEAIAEACQPPRPQRALPLRSWSTRIPLSSARHHSVDTVWEYFRDGGWEALNKTRVVDRTRGMTLDGAVQLDIPNPGEKTQIGVVDAEHVYLRCRLRAGRPDAAPHLARLALNTVPAVQRTPVRSTLPIVAGLTPDGTPEVGTRQRVALELNDDDEITSLRVGSDVTGPDPLLLDFQKPTADRAGSITMTLALLGRGNGLPEQTLRLPAAAVAGGEITVWAGEERWQQQSNLDASERADPHFVLDAEGGTLRFGDGENGRVLPPGAPVLAAYDITDGAAGNVAARTSLAITSAERELNQQYLLDNADPASALAALDAIVNLEPAVGGTDAETVNAAAGRAAARLWAHERLVELCPASACATLDQQPREVVLARTIPQRAVTVLDFERLALAVPGTEVRRARAWAGIDPNHPCLDAPGTLTVVIVPALPDGRPVPSAGLLRLVRAYLERHRVLGTRLVVAGPCYLQVAVRATVRAYRRADRERVMDDIRRALDRFLDPLRGGPTGQGWPFGRDVYRSEILQMIDSVAGVDHVLELELVPDGGEAQCGNLCVGPTWLVTPGTHRLEVVQ